jgi:site-specific recombinase XerD
LAIPTKRFQRTAIEFLTRPEIEALLNAPDPATWIGRRDRTLLLLAAQTGLRVSELVGLCCGDVVLGHGAYVHCLGKGRKARCTPLRKDAVRAMHEWLRERAGASSDPLFPNQSGGVLSRDSIEHIVRKYVGAAAKHCPSLQHKRISPHVLRHSAAMDLLQHGVDSVVIALWLGHESVETTQVYLHADMQMKEKALERSSPANVLIGRYQPDDALLSFLEGL